MVNPPKEAHIEPPRASRRTFFGWFSASVVGGLAGGSFFRTLVGRRSRAEQKPIVMRPHDLSVPRTKKG